MTEISAVGLEEKGISFNPEEKEVKSESLERQEITANQGDTEKRMVAEEFLRMATHPNIREMQRIEKIKQELETSIPLDEKFYLTKELFTRQVEAYKNSGKDMTRFVILAKGAFSLADEEQQPYIDLIFSNEEKEIYLSYKRLCTLARECERKVYKFSSFEEYQANNPQLYAYCYLQLFHLEKDLGCSISGSELITREVMVFMPFLRFCRSLKDSPSFFSSSQQNEVSQLGSRLYWEVVLPGLKQVLDLLEKTQEIKKVGKLPHSMLGFSIASSDLSRFPWDKNKIDIVALFFSHLVKYGDGTLEIVRERFDEIHQDLKAWDKAFKWVELHIKAAELLSSSNPEKAKMYLNKARELTQDTLQPSILSLHYGEWNKKYKEATVKIEEAGKGST